MKQLLIILILLLPMRTLAQGTQFDRIQLNTNAGIVQQYVSGAAITTGHLVKMNSSGQVIETVAADTAGVLGVAVNSVGGSGVIVSIGLLVGQYAFVTDGACNKGNFVTLSSTTGGLSHCSASITSTQQLGYSLTTIASAGTIEAALSGGSGGGGSGGGGSSVPPLNAIQKAGNGGLFVASSLSDDGTTVSTSEAVSLTGNLASSGTNSFTGPSNTFSNPVVITQATGTAPLTISSTTVVPNLNAALLNGNTFPSPGPIGGTTPAASTFTTVTANTSLSINGGSALTTTNQSGTGNLCLVTNCALATPTITNPTVTTGTFSTPALTAPTVGGETISAAPRGPFNAYLPGALTATWTGESWTIDKAITVTRVQVQLRTAPSGCGTNAIVQLTDGSSPINLTLTAAGNDSGAISQNYAAASVLTLLAQTAASACTISPGDANVVVQYKMQ